MDKKLNPNFFSRSADKVAYDLLGKILVRRFNKKILKARIIEIEAYFGEKDPASWARFGKRKDNIHMWSEPGVILIKNVHKYFMLNFSTGKKGKPEAVLIRAIQPLNFSGRCNGPGLLTLCLKINKTFNGKNIFNCNDFWIENSNKKFKIKKGFRVGVVKDLNKKLRFYTE